MSFVIDSSVALAWTYLDELTPGTEKLSRLVTERGAWAPSIWRLEMANSLHFSLRRRRITKAFRDQAIDDLSQLNISIDTQTDQFAWTTTIRLSDRYALTLYDACYLELAQRRNLPLATRDKDLRKAARALGTELLDA